RAHHYPPQLTHGGHSSGSPVAVTHFLAPAGAHAAVEADLHEIVARTAVDDDAFLVVRVDDVVAAAGVDLVEAVAGETDRVRAAAAGDVVGGGRAAALQIVVAVAAVDVGLATARRAVHDVVTGTRVDAVDAAAAPGRLAVGPDDVVAGEADQRVRSE